MSCRILRQDLLYRNSMCLFFKYLIEAKSKCTKKNAVKGDHRNTKMNDYGKKLLLLLLKNV